MSQSQDLLKRLQHMQRLIERACAERDLAYAEAIQWKQRYEAEAHQRRVEHDELIQQLESETQSLPTSKRKLDAQETIETQDAIANGNDAIAALSQEREQLKLALEQEKANHQKTRASLITALGDALQRK